MGSLHKNDTSQESLQTPQTSAPGRRPVRAWSDGRRLRPRTARTRRLGSLEGLQCCNELGRVRRRRHSASIVTHFYAQRFATIHEPVGEWIGARSGAPPASVQRADLGHGCTGPGGSIIVHRIGEGRCRTPATEHERGSGSVSTVERNLVLSPTGRFCINGWPFWKCLCSRLAAALPLPRFRPVFRLLDRRLPRDVTRLVIAVILQSAQ